MIRLFDFLFSFIGLVILSPIFLILYLIGILDTGAPIFKQERVGKGMKPFYLFKFRSMKIETKSIATHLASANSITKYGKFLRKSKLDELPQLWNVLLGDMSLVGPRPNLFNQHDLIKEREIRFIYNVRPGITGLAQISEIDMSTPEVLAETDAKMIEKLNFKTYIYFIIITILGKGSGDRIIK